MASLSSVDFQHGETVSRCLDPGLDYAVFSCESFTLGWMARRYITVDPLRLSAGRALTNLSGALTLSVARWLLLRIPLLIRWVSSLLKEQAETDTTEPELITGALIKAHADCSPECLGLG
jgi:hypothetical protein